ncbi:YciI family protein [Fictibacillus aquaticus]|uniref:YCII-related domain-containing protein n=1 Tax=Fictibacillus aquaticus TaxID=2021314 RepID=A0A235FDA9_9BACL|nr:YciI family protein [Fictibacillus aquaticus]OYD59338.1 hypothetical protein CGZ90_05460 [Fictibacillus aquaticus]
MIYLCLGYFNPDKMKALTKEELDTVMKECQPHLEKLYKTGQVMLDAGVESESKCLQRVNGELSVTDGPLTGTNETVGSAFFIEAENMEEAIHVASMHPTTQVSKGMQLGWRIEIRPVHYFKKDEQDS